jgi:hypothetical protein
MNNYIERLNGSLDIFRAEDIEAIGQGRCPNCGIAMEENPHPYGFELECLTCGFVISSNLVSELLG